MEQDVTSKDDAVKEASAAEAVSSVKDAAKSASSDTGKKPKGRIHRARNICIWIIFLSIIAGLMLRLGWGTLSSLGVDAVAYLCPLGALESLVAGKEFVPRLLIALVCVVLFVVLFGRLFCSWICVVPPLRRFFHPKDKDGRKASSVKAGKADGDASETACASAYSCTNGEGGHAAEASASAACTSCSGCAGAADGKALGKVGGKRDGLQLDSRHGVLAGALVSSAICGFPVFCLVCPIGLSIALVVGIYSAVFEQNPTVSILIFLGILLIELAFFRKWCSKICPVGAFMSLVGAKAPLLKPRVNHEECLRTAGVDCQVCVRECPELLDPHSENISECTRCGKCIDACPAHAISFRKPRKARAAKAAAAE